MAGHTTYSSISNALEAVGIASRQSRHDQLIVSTQVGPVWPNAGNSFWLSYQKHGWYLSTWLPACYRIPSNQDLVALCVACMEASSSAMYRVPEAIVERFRLERLSEREFEELFPV
jgi:hypothetical protein